MQPQDNTQPGQGATGAATPRDAAWAAHSAALCVVPPREDGSKAPISEWKSFQECRPTAPQLQAWYGPHTGVGLVCGAVSDNLEVFEFDDHPTYLDFKARAGAVGLGDLVERIEASYLEQSPSDGIHWPYHCDEISGNAKLARRPKTPGEMRHPKDKIKVLIETRGEGGYIIIAPTNGRVHPTGKLYILLQGGFATIATITPAERRDLWELARTFDQMPAGNAEHAVKLPATSPGGRPGDDFNTRAGWREILERWGWKLVYEHSVVAYWRRPGKDSGVSATTNYHGSGLLYVFSTSTAFESERGYSKFAAYALLEHSGDFREAAKALTGQGYGAARRRRQLHRPRVYRRGSYLVTGVRL